jgi:zinc transport system ATP-binding protein
VSVPALEVQGVHLAYRGVPVLEDVHLTLAEGDYLGIIGPNGAGKTVLLEVILGLRRPDRGTVRVFGKPVAQARGEVAYVPQYARFDRDYPVRVLDVVLMGRLGRDRLFRPLREEDREKARVALAEAGIADLAQRQIGKLSGGQLQRVLIARALAVEARILILDEPTASLDTPIAARLYEYLAKLAERMTVILVSHDIGIIPRYVKSIGCMNRRFFMHDAKEITQEMIEETYGCPVDMLVHRHTHRVVDEHGAGS